jgi:polyhydroxybutyrate depolymerase
MKKYKVPRKKNHVAFCILTIVFIAFILLCFSPNGYAQDKNNNDDRGWFGAAKDFLSSAEEVDVDKRLAEIKIGEELRKYYLHLPKGRKEGSPIPLVFAFHSGHGGGLRLAEQSGFNALADKEGFAIVYPDATEQWYDGRGRAKSDKDILFTKVLIKKFVKENNIDPARVFATGILNGGLFTLRLACDMADEFAAFAPLLATMPADYFHKCQPSKRVPLVLFSGTKSKIIPWKGGTVAFGSTFRSGGKVVSIDKTLEFWREHNDCSASASAELLPDLDKTDGTRVEVVTYKNCFKGSALTHIIIKNGGSAWPGSSEKPSRMRTTMIGITSYDIDATMMIWEFFKEHSPKQKH